MKPTQNMFMDDVQESEEVVEQTKKKVKKETEVPKPANVLDLPSGGKFGYPSFVQYRDMLAKDEEILASSTAENYARVLNGVIKSVIMDCEFYENMTTYDRDYVLIWLWANNYTAKKTVEIECKDGSTENVEVDLTQLDVTEPSEKFTGAFTLDLKNGKSVKVRLNTVGDEIATETYLSKNKQHRYEYLMMVQSIDVGVPMLLETKLKWVGENLTAKEMGIIKQFHAKFAYGVKTRLEHKCACGEVTKFDLPFSIEDILHPTVQFDFEEYV
jgi:hypothetical protein